MAIYGKEGGVNVGSSWTTELLLLKEFQHSAFGCVLVLWFRGGGEQDFSLVVGALYSAHILAT